MSRAVDHFEVGSVVLGYVGLVASWRKPCQDPVRAMPPMLIIQSSGGADDGVYEPPVSITIIGKVGLLALRQAIDEALKEPSP